MPIKKIIVSEEMVKKIEAGQSGGDIPVFIAVPAGTAPGAMDVHRFRRLGAHRRGND